MGHDRYGLPLLRPGCLHIRDFWGDGVGIDCCMKTGDHDAVIHRVVIRAVVELARLCSVQLAGAANQDGCEVGPDGPAAPFLGVGRYRAMNRLTQAQGIELGGVGDPRHFNVAQAFSPRQLGQRHDAKRLGAGHATYARVARIALYNTRAACP